MKSYRLNRLFNAKSARCFDVAIDHGFFNEPSFLAGIENLPRAVATLVAAAPDAIQLTVDQECSPQSLLRTSWKSAKRRHHCSVQHNDGRTGRHCAGRLGGNSCQ